MQVLNVSQGYDQLPSRSKLVDGFGRTINYLPLTVTDRCNLRCRDCMPKESILQAEDGESRKTAR